MARSRGCRPSHLWGGLGARLEVFGMFGAVGSVEAPDDQGSVQGRVAVLIW